MPRVVHPLTGQSGAPPPAGSPAPLTRRPAVRQLLLRAVTAAILLREEAAPAPRTPPTQQPTGGQPRQPQPTRRRAATLGPGQGGRWRRGPGARGGRRRGAGWCRPPPGERRRRLESRQTPTGSNGRASPVPSASRGFPAQSRWRRECWRPLGEAARRAAPRARPFLVHL